MKKFLKYIIVFFVMLPIVSCNDGIDPITEVAPGADATAPVVTIKAPLAGAKFKVNDPIISIDVEFEVTDDIEVGSIKVFIDGSEIASYSDFIDYRRVLQALTANNIATGVHELKVTATDLDGKSTSTIVSFEKEPPYIPLFANEILYMAFDNDYVELISVTPTTKVGSPGFAGTSVVGSNAYAGATDSYLTFPSAGLNLGTELSASFWYKVNNNPDRAGVLTLGPTDTANPTAQNNRKNGFRFFRENAGGKQRFKLNVGNGTADTWVDGGAAADVAAGSDWVHMAFTISGTEARVYIGGVLVKESTITGVDWTGCDILSIMSGAPRFTGWSHKSDSSFMDDLRLFSKKLTQAEIQNIIAVTNPYAPAPNETLYMPFDNNYINVVSNTTATKVGTSGYAGEAKKGTNAYMGATDSYLSLPITNLFANEFSGAFWYKVDATPDRAGILTVAPPMNGTDNNLTSGFRLFREGNGTQQRIKLHLGTNNGDVWNDGDVIDVTANAWVHIAFTVSSTKTQIYINGVAVSNSGNMTGKTISWANCTNISIGSGAPGFIGWNHLSDLSKIDELHLYNKTLTLAEIQSLM